jgi:Type I phosphodiesterase / nucleotide pyrophosphatase
MRLQTRLGVLVFGLAGIVSTRAQSGTAARQPHVIVIGIDGLSVDAVENTPTPRLHELMARAAWTLEARGVMPTLSSPNWESVIGGAPPEQHGITSNGYFRPLVEFAPACRDVEGKFPTIFGVLRDQRPASHIAVFHEWGGFANLVERRGPDVIKHESSSARTMGSALEYWKERHPSLLFIHLDGVDHAGHQTGWFSANYYRAVQEADSYTGQLLDELNREDAWDSTYVLVTSDHGGTRHGHGRNSLAEILIPWILAGPGVIPGRLQTPVNTYDTAATLAWIFNVEPPGCWTGRPVQAAFPPSLLTRTKPAPAPPQPSCAPMAPVTGAALRLPSQPENSLKATQ